jgi:hypothetical protein
MRCFCPAFRIALLPDLLIAFQTPTFSFSRGVYAQNAAFTQMLIKSAIARARLARQDYQTDRGSMKLSFVEIASGMPVTSDEPSG